jgi:hypothetical protein
MCFTNFGIVRLRLDENAARMNSNFHPLGCDRIPRLIAIISAVRRPKLYSSIVVNTRGELGN